MLCVVAFPKSEHISDGRFVVIWKYYISSPLIPYNNTEIVIDNCYNSKDNDTVKTYVSSIFLALSITLTSRAVGGP